jgi:cyclase
MELIELAMSRNNIRLISRLDIKGPNLIKSIQFDGHRVLGTAEEFAEIYYNEGVDELIYQDTVASLYRRNSLIEVVKNMAGKIFIPLTVAGGINIFPAIFFTTSIRLFLLYKLATVS